MALPPVPAAPTLSAATSGDETKLYLDVGAGWVEVAEVTDMPDLPSGQQSTYKTTHMGSAGFEEFKKNKRVEGAETNIEGNYTILSASDATLVAADASREPIPYLLVLIEDEKTYNAVGRALFYSLKRSNPVNEVRKFTITAKWVTPMTLALAA